MNRFPQGAPPSKTLFEILKILFDEKDARKLLDALASRALLLDQPVHTSNVIPETDTDACTACGKCADACPVEAMSVVSANDPVNSTHRVVPWPLNGETFLTGKSFA
ncbi:MAG: ATP-binding protein [Spirochaetaceae bacterium]